VAVAAAVERTFLAGQDEDFEALLVAVSAMEDDDNDPSVRLVDVQHGATGASALMVAAGKGRADMVSGGFEMSKGFKRFRSVSEMFQKCFKNVSKMFQKCFKNN
jgi:hypothetical protein